MIAIELIKNRLLALKGVFCRDFLRLPLKTKVAIFKLAAWEKPVAFGKNIFVSTFAAPINSPVYARFLDWFNNFVNGKYAPRYLDICITNKCFYNCEHCSNKDAATGNEITAEEIMKVYDFFAEKGTFKVIFTGGEPLLHPEIVSIIANMDKNKASTVICTSGFRLTKEKAEELKEAGLNIVKIGLDSCDEKKNDSYKNFKGAHKNSLAAIKNAREAGLCVIVQTVLQKELIESPQDFFKFIDFLEKLGVHELQFLEPKPCGKYFDTDKLIGRKEKEAFFKLSRKVNRSLRRIKCSSYFETEEKMGCTAGVCSFYLDAIGNLMPCCFAPITFGNIREESLETIYGRFRSIITKPSDRCLSFKVAAQKKAGLKVNCYSLGKNEK